MYLALRDFKKFFKRRGRFIFSWCDIWDQGKDRIQVLDTSETVDNGPGTYNNFKII
jgi:hypothetical protein